MALIHRLRQFGRGVVSDGLGAEIGSVATESGLSGGYFSSFA